MEPPQNPFDPPAAPIQADARRPVALAAALWVVFFSAVLVNLVNIWRTRALFAAMYEGLGSSLPVATRFFLNPVSHAVALLAVPLVSIAAGIAWRLRPKAGLAVLMLAVALGIGWAVAYRWALRLPIVRSGMESVFDATNE